MKYIIDIDGTLLNGTSALPGAAAFMDRLQTGSRDYLVMTNSIKDPVLQAERLRNAGISTRPENILNPIAAINRYLADTGTTRVKLVGTDAEERQLQAECVNTGYDCIVLLDFEKGNKTYNDLQEILTGMENGIRVITASASLYYLKNGSKTIDTGSFVKLLEEITNTKIKNLGKPSETYFDIAGRILNEVPGNMCVIGDDWSTDIQGANGWGARAVLVRSGKYRPGDETKCLPCTVVDSLSEIQL